MRPSRATHGRPSRAAQQHHSDPRNAAPLGPRPGWHLECSAMAHKYLGPAFDIHGGGPVDV
ncbi:hypothetical protein AB0I50_48425, partial [Streptomyces prunicolor]